MPARRGASADGTATERILRVLLLVTGAALPLFLALLGASITAQWPTTATWWNVLALTVLAAAAVALVVVAQRGGVRRMRAVAGAIALAVTALLILRLAAGTGQVSLDDAPWIINLGAFTATLAGVSFRAGFAWFLVVIVGIGTWLVRWLTCSPPDVLLGVQNGVQSLAFCSIFVLMGLSITRAGEVADRAIGDARRQTASAASARARGDVRERLDALVHDRVLATLLLAGRSGDEAGREVAARSADDALRALGRQHHDGVEEYAPIELVWAMQGLVRDLDPETQFGYELDEGVVAVPKSPTIPGRIGDALVEACLEALRNSLRHAGDGTSATTRAVHVIASPTRVVVHVLDDGVGFDPQQVDEGRLGIAASIRGRMRAVGGTGRIASVPGQGTRVVLEWDRDAAHDADQQTLAQSSAGRPWATRAQPSPLDLDFWIGPPADRGLDPEPSPLPESGPPGDDDRRHSLQRRIQREPLLVFAVIQTCSNIVLAFASDAAVAVQWQSLVSLVLYLVAIGLVALPGQTPLRLRWALTVVALGAVITALIDAMLPLGVNPGYAGWHLGGNTLLFLALGLRGRIGLSWVGMALMVVITVISFELGDVPLWEAVPLLDRNIATLFVGTLFALVLRRTMLRALAVQRVLDERAARTAAATAALDERDRILRRFEEAALPALRTIAAAPVVDAATQRAWLALEAELRDRIRARTLDVEPLRGAVRRARERGVRVVVLDDAGGAGLTAAQAARALAWAAERLDAEVACDVTVRLRSTGEGLALTLVGAEVEEFVVSVDQPVGASGPGSEVQRGV